MKLLIVQHFYLMTSLLLLCLDGLKERFVDLKEKLKQYPEKVVLNQEKGLIKKLKK